MVLRYLLSAKLKSSDEHWQDYVSLLHLLSHISCSLQPITLSGMDDTTLSHHNLLRLLFQQESSYRRGILRDAWTTNDIQPPQKIPFSFACVHFSSLGKMLLDAMQYEYQQHVSRWSVAAWDYAYIVANDTRITAGLMGIDPSVASLKYALPHHESVWMWLLAYTASPQTLSVGEARGFFWRGWQESLLPSDQIEGGGISEVTAVRIGRAFKALERLQPAEFEHGVSVFQSVWRMNMSVAVVMQAAHQLTPDQHYQHVLLRYTLRHNALWRAIHTNRIDVDRSLFAKKLMQVLEHALQASDSHTLACVWMYVQRIGKDHVHHHVNSDHILEELNPVMRKINRYLQSLACMPALDDDALNFNDASSDAILSHYGFKGDTYQSAKCFFEKISRGIDKSCKAFMEEKKVLEDENTHLKAALHAAEQSLLLLQFDDASEKRKSKKKHVPPPATPSGALHISLMVLQKEIQQLEVLCATIQQTYSVSTRRPTHHAERADKMHASTQTVPISSIIDSKGAQVAGHASNRSLRRFTDASTQSASSLKCMDACTESASRTSTTQTVSTQTVDQQHINAVAPTCDTTFEKKDGCNDAAHVAERMQARIKQLEKETQRSAKQLYVLTMARLRAESDAYQLACEAHMQQTVLRQELAYVERTMAASDAASTRSHSTESASTFFSSSGDLSLFATGVCVESKETLATMVPQSEQGKEHTLCLPLVCASHHQDDANVQAPVVANVQDVPAEHALGASTHSVFDSDGFVTVDRKKATISSRLGY